MSKNKGKKKIGLIGLLIVLLVIVVTFFVFCLKNASACGDGSKQETLIVHEGESFNDVLSDLEKMELIHSQRFAKIFSKTKGDVSYYAGQYQLNDGMNLQEIFAYLSNPSNAKVDSVTITIPEGKWAKEIAEIIAQNFDYTKDDIISYWNDENTLRTLCDQYEFLNFDEINKAEYKIKLEGYLYPETYSIPTEASLEEITKILLNQFDCMYQEYKDDFNNSSYSVHQIVTLASVVQFESGYASDMPTIASVFYNRLNSDMMLQSSVTVCYALYDDFNDPQDCEVQTDIDSPYNTYLYSGLPVGPILNPGKEAFDAVLHPAQTDYYYFAADIHGDGKVYYSRTYDEHMQICEQLNLGL
ncbi:endolytic transglycosylase MltG [Floccifex sp.]|uniref:endolytic transglycosylase MltG n=1 Tax=Floccifex sp. TaxID=2815810 RepID=UPI003F0EBFE2